LAGWVVAVGAEAAAAGRGVAGLEMEAVGWGVEEKEKVEVSERAVA
jgi:hypothetical protein